MAENDVVEERILLKILLTDCLYLDHCKTGLFFKSIKDAPGTIFTQQCFDSISLLLITEYLPFPADCPQLPECFSFNSNSFMVCTCTRKCKTKSLTDGWISGLINLLIDCFKRFKTGQPARISQGDCVITLLLMYLSLFLQ